MKIPDIRTQTRAMDETTYLAQSTLPVMTMFRMMQKTAIADNEIVNSLKKVVRFLKNGNATETQSSRTDINGKTDQVIVELACRSIIMGIKPAMRKHMERMNPVSRLATLRRFTVE